MRPQARPTRRKPRVQFRIEGEGEEDIVEVLFGRNGGGGGDGRGDDLGGFGGLLGRVSLSD